MLPPVDVSTNKAVHTDSRIIRVCTRSVKPTDKKINYVGILLFTKFKYINIYYKKRELINRIRLEVNLCINKLV